MYYSIHYEINFQLYLMLAFYIIRAPPTQGEKGRNGLERREDSFSGDKTLSGETIEKKEGKIADAGHAPINSGACHSRISKVLEKVGDKSPPPFNNQHYIYIYIILYNYIKL